MRQGRIGLICGSSLGSRRVYAQEAHQVGQIISSVGWNLVCGGSRLGLIGVVADSVLAGGGEVYGVIPRSMVNRDVAHPCLTSLLVVDSVENRRTLIESWSDAFLVLPGSLSTYNELFELLAVAQLGRRAKPCGLLNTAGFYDPLIMQINRAISDGFLKSTYRNLLMVDNNPERLLEGLTRQKISLIASAR